MKRRLINFFMGVIVAIMIAPAFATAAGTCTQELDMQGQDIAVLTITCTADASAATYPSTVLDAGKLKQARGWYFKHLFIDPGATGPTADTDLYIKIYGTLDILQGRGVDLVENSDSTSAYFGLGHDTDELLTPVPYLAPNQAPTLTIANNAVNSAVIVLHLTLERP